MTKRKVILLPDDERILNLFKGNIGSTKKSGAARRAIYKKLAPDQSGLRLYEALIKITVGIALLPFILLAVFIMLIAVLIGYLFVGKKIVAFQDKCFKWLDLFKHLIPYRDRDIKFKSQPHWKGVEEDVPGMLKMAKKYNYHIVIYVKNANKLNISRSKKLQTAGWIDEVLEYNDKNELFIYIKNNNVSERYSWILEVPKVDIRLSTESFKNILCIDKVPHASYHPERHFNSFKNACEKMIFSRIQLRSSPLLKGSTVLYFERSYEPAINNYIIKHYEEIQQVLQSRNIQLIYFPAIKKFNELDLNFISSFGYMYPDLLLNGNSIEKVKIEEWIKDIDLNQLYVFFDSTFQIPDLPLPGFIRCLKNDEQNSNDELVDYSFFPIWGKDEKSVKEEVDQYLSLVGVDSNKIFFNLSGPDDSPYDPDFCFNSDGSSLNEEIKNKIADIKMLSGEKSVFETLFYVIKEFKDVNPKLCKKLCKQLYDEANLLERKLSRIYIDKSYRIFLTDYKNMEIEMTPLPKTLFFFLLKYPNGVMLKELYKHKQELLYIYGRISNRTDLEQMQSSINDMTNATSNSINEKCSRIKEAFVSKIDDRIASSYYITGDRQEPKRITLERSLVVFQEMV